MKPTTDPRLAASLAAAVLSGALIYNYLISWNPIARLTVTWAMGALIGIFAYVAVGLLARGLLPVDSPRFEVPTSQPRISALLRPLPGMWQVLRIALALYLGALAFALTQNALFNPAFIRALAVAVGTAVLVGALYWPSRPAKP